MGQVGFVACLALAGVTVLAGCASMKSTASPAELAAAFDVARARISQAVVLDDSSKSLLAKPPAGYRYYKLGGDFYDYAFQWNLSSNRVVAVRGQGDLRRMEDCIVSVGSAQH